MHKVGRYWGKPYDTMQYQGCQQTRNLLYNISIVADKGVAPHVPFRCQPLHFFCGVSPMSDSSSSP